MHTLKDVSSFLSALEECRDTKDLSKGTYIHSQATYMGLSRNPYISCSLISMYSKCGSMGNAHQVFDSLQPHTNVVLWNCLIQGYVENGEAEVALKLFNNMERVKRDERTYVSALVACVNLVTKGRSYMLETAKCIHFKAVMEQCCDIIVENTLIDLYGKCGKMGEARNLFEGMAQRNVVSWTALLQGYVDNKECEVALELFENMQESPNARTYVVALSACADMARKDDKTIEKGKAIHAEMLFYGVLFDAFVDSSLVNMYTSCGSMHHARVIFDNMVEHNVVSWNCLVRGYVENGESQMALEMVDVMNMEPNASTYLAALVACGDLMEIKRGERLHSEISTLGLDKDLSVATCLVEFYCKCGKMECAREVFESIALKDTCAWNTLMCGYSERGEAERVFDIFKKMKEQAVKPNAITFTHLLCVCSHAGVTEEAWSYFEVMKCEYGIEPDIVHYSVMVDLLSRANCLEEALKVVRNMPVPPNAVTWTAILGACWKWKNVVVGRIAFEALLELDGADSGAYALMANIYGNADMFDEQVEVLERERMVCS